VSWLPRQSPLWGRDSLSVHLASGMPFLVFFFFFFSVLTSLLCSHFFWAKCSRLVPCLLAIGHRRRRGSAAASLCLTSSNLAAARPACWCCCSFPSLYFVFGRRVSGVSIPIRSGCGLGAPPPGPPAAPIQITSEIITGGSRRRARGRDQHEGDLSSRTRMSRPGPRRAPLSSSFPSGASPRGRIPGRCSRGFFLSFDPSVSGNPPSAAKKKKGNHRS